MCECARVAIHATMHTHNHGILRLYMYVYLTRTDCIVHVQNAFWVYFPFISYQKAGKALYIYIYIYIYISGQSGFLFQQGGDGEAQCTPLPLACIMFTIPDVI
jgi:hypothetical protein